MPTRSIKDNEGIVLVVAMVFLVAMGILATYSYSRVMNNSRHVEHYVDYVHTYEGIEAGLAQARSELQSGGGDGLVGVDPTFNFINGNPNFGDPLVNPLQISTMQEIEYFAYSFDWSNDGIDNNGDGLIDIGPEDAGYFSIYAVARANRNGNVTVRRSAESIVQANNINVWQNAIFAGSGQAGNLINGNISIHGSVHLLGDNLTDGGVAIAALDLSGTSLIHNNYDGLDADLEARIPPLPRTMVNGEDVETVNAVLRVKHGLVGMSGNTEVGEADVAGNDTKETMDGVYVTDGWTGNDMDAEGNPRSVFSDNGFSEEYDLGDAVLFPNFEDDGGSEFLDYYLQEDAPNVGLHFNHVGSMTITANENYYWDATTGVEVINGTPGVDDMPAMADLDPTHYFVWFEEGSNRLVANGRIVIEGGDLVLATGGGSDKTMNYSGKATFMAQDNAMSGADRDIRIEVNLLSMNLDGTTDDSFPHENLFGFLAENDLYLGSTAQIKVMGGFYAQNAMTVNRQTTIIGTIVGDVFNMGINVPDIFQVPDLVDAWEPEMRMIGADPVLFLSPVSWRELNVL